jgi:hypothetical protein
MKGAHNMNRLVRDILRDAVDMAKQTGIWQLLTKKEKEDIVRYFRLNFGPAMAMNEERGRERTRFETGGDVNRF